MSEEQRLHPTAAGFLAARFSAALQKCHPAYYRAHEDRMTALLKIFERYFDEAIAAAIDRGSTADVLIPANGELVFRAEREAAIPVEHRFVSASRLDFAETGDHFPRGVVRLSQPGTPTQWIPSADGVCTTVTHPLRQRLSNPLYIDSAHESDIALSYQGGEGIIVSTPLAPPRMQESDSPMVPSPMRIYVPAMGNELWMLVPGDSESADWARLNCGRAVKFLGFLVTQSGASGRSSNDLFLAQYVHSMELDVFGQHLKHWKQHPDERWTKGPSRASVEYYGYLIRDWHSNRLMLFDLRSFEILELSPQILTTISEGAQLLLGELFGRTIRCVARAEYRDGVRYLNSPMSADLQAHL